MGLLGSIIIALVISSASSVCPRRSRQAVTSLVQSLLSNPQLLKLAANRQLCSQPAVYAPTYESRVIPTQYTSSYVQSSQPQTVIEMPYPVAAIAQPQAFKGCQTYATPAVQVAEVYQPPKVTQQVQTVSQTVTAPTCKCPAAAPAPLVSPFLPAASPMSALAPPTSPILPPANPATFRSNYLRKIPIPPPCL